MSNNDLPNITQTRPEDIKVELGNDADEEAHSPDVPQSSVPMDPSGLPVEEQE